MGIRRLSLPLLAAMMAISGCGGDETVARYGGAGRVWQLIEIDGQATSDRLTLQFPQTGQVAGQGPCNSYKARMIAPYPWFDIEQIVAGQSPCAEQATEARLFALLGEVTQSEVLKDTLILSGSGVELLFRARG